MRRAFGGNLNPDGVTLGADTESRINYFQDPHHNKADGDGPNDRPEEEPTMDVVRQFGQVILYGPPGTGKTREAKRAALALLSGNKPPVEASGNKPPVEATAMEIEGQLRLFHELGRYEIVVFHPAYEYEQFVGGIEPMVLDRQLAFQVRAGVFLRLCRYAERSDQPAVLIIDEINRGSLPKLLGELVHALEYRDHMVTLPFVCDGRSDLVVPHNLYIIATMNSSDRSIGHIDVAIRRRFGLYHVGPEPNVVRSAWRSVRESPDTDWPGSATYDDQLARWMTDLNSSLGGEDPAAEVELGVGHSYFLPAPGSTREEALRQVRMKWKYQVRPLLHQYAQVLNLGAEFFQRFRDLPAPPA